MNKKSLDCLLFPRFYANFASNYDFGFVDLPSATQSCKGKLIINNN